MKKLLIPLALLMALCFTNNVEAQTKARLIAQSQRVLSGTGAYSVFDSTVYWYSSGRGSDLRGMQIDFYYDWWLTWDIKFDSSIRYRNGPTGLFAKEKCHQMFDGGNSVTDSTVFLSSPSAVDWKNHLRKTALYNSANKKIFAAQEQYSVTWDSMKKTDFTYTATNKLLTETIYTNTVGGWVPQYKYIYAYNSVDSVSVVLSQTWGGAGAWENLQLNSYTYDASGNIIEDVVESWNSTIAAWDKFQKNVYTYDAMRRNLTKQWIYWDVGAGAWQAGGNRTTFSDFVGYNPGKVVMETWMPATSSYENYAMQLLAYNSYGLPVAYEHNIPWNTSTLSWGTPEFTHHYYYELYTAQVQPASENDKVNIYPIPASDKLSITVDWVAPQAVSASISDLEGRVYSRWEVPVCSHYSHEIAVNHMPPGNYIIRLEGEKERVIKSIVVVPTR